MKKSLGIGHGVANLHVYKFIDFLRLSEASSSPTGLDVHKRSHLSIRVRSGCVVVTSREACRLAVYEFKKFYFIITEFHR